MNRRLLPPLDLCHSSHMNQRKLRRNNYRAKSFEHFVTIFNTFPEFSKFSFIFPALIDVNLVGAQFQVQVVSKSGTWGAQGLGLEG